MAPPNRDLLSWTVSVDHKFGIDLAGYFWLKVSYEVTIKMSGSILRTTCMCSHLRSWLPLEQMGDPI